MKKTILFVITIVAVAFLASCRKTPQQPLSKAAAVSGTYSGSITSDGVKTTSVAHVEPLTDSTVSIHCFDDSLGMDTTFVMQLFENGDSVMLCSTGEDFYNQYGHNMYDMMDDMMGSSGMTEWERFMDAQHDPGNGHYGSFDRMNGHFNYPFTEGDTVMMTFFGTRQ
jgi:hypothetical protein